MPRRVVLPVPLASPGRCDHRDHGEIDAGEENPIPKLETPAGQLGGEPSPAFAARPPPRRVDRGCWRIAAAPSRRGSTSGPADEAREGQRGWRKMDTDLLMEAASEASTCSRERRSPSHRQMRTLAKRWRVARRGHFVIQHILASRRAARDYIAASPAPATCWCCSTSIFSTAACASTTLH
jgi:hypothetical protein